jgi:PAS domain-containing protein
MSMGASDTAVLDAAAGPLTDSGADSGLFADPAKTTRTRDLAYDALQESETRYRRLFETARDGILLLNADTGQIPRRIPRKEAMGSGHVRGHSAEQRNVPQAANRGLCPI